MPTYLAISNDGTNGLNVQPITAANRDAAAAAIKQQLAQGLGVNGDGSRNTIQIGLVDLAAFGTITPDPNAANAAISYTNQAQAAIADLPAFTVGSVAQANTAVQAIRTAFNTLLAELRAAGVILP